ncbi:glycosyltransferase [Planococcus sp. SSTMD024]|uniref:glycosyltransferase n=1 Tax=Planococcus sp. SSTMD024 TaxID=3242163 RepID=UPI00351EBAA0
MSKLKKVSIYVRNKEITPSSYYRIIQYCNKFEGEINIKELVPSNFYKLYLNYDKEKKINYFILKVLYFLIIFFRVTVFLLYDIINKPDSTIVSKTFFPRHTPNLTILQIKKLVKHTKLYWDFDDHILGSGEIDAKQFELLEKESEKIIVSNIFLKSKINPLHQDKVISLPTTDGDFQGFNKNEINNQRKKSFNKEVKLVWVATSGNLPHLEKIIPILEEAAFKMKKEKKKKLELSIVCNKPLKTNTTYLQIRNIKWSREKAKEEMFNAHIGIMPLIYSEYALGKAGFKLVQYISTQLPVIGSDVGFNNEVIEGSSGILVDDREHNENWIEAIDNLTESWDKWEEYSHNAGLQWNEKFSFKNNLKIWKSMLGV